MYFDKMKTLQAYIRLVRTIKKDYELLAGKFTVGGLVYLASKGDMPLARVADCEKLVRPMALKVLGVSM